MIDAPIRERTPEQLSQSLSIHGLKPTHLPDWIRSPLIALHFAMTESDYTQMDKHDAVVWKIDIPDLKKQLPDEYRDA